MIRNRTLALLLACAVAAPAGVTAEEGDNPSPAAPATAPSPAVQTHGVVRSTAGEVGPDGKPVPNYASEDRWEHTGYNLDEIVYTVFITNQDSRILRCRTEVHGVYVDDKTGKKGEISDLQITTVFPNKQQQAGIWSGLDEQSGARYSVTCKAI